MRIMQTTRPVVQIKCTCECVLQTTRTVVLIKCTCDANHKPRGTAKLYVWWNNMPCGGIKLYLRCKQLGRPVVQINFTCDANHTPCLLIVYTVWVSSCFRWWQFTLRLACKCMNVRVYLWSPWLCTLLNKWIVLNKKNYRHNQSSCPHQQAFRL